jgi:hypothetical protein
MNTLFGALARARGARALHPRGCTHDASWMLTADPARLPSVDLLQATRPQRVLVRVSRGVGGPARHQDLLLVSSVDAPLLNNLPVPRIGMAGAQFSSLLPFDVAGQRLLFGARVMAAPRDVATMEADWRGLRIELMIGTRLGRFHPIGLLELGTSSIESELRFDPWNTDPAIRPAGWWNRVRVAAYAGSRQGSR